MDNFMYLVCFGVGLLFTLVSAVFGHLFGGHDGHMDVGTGGQAEAGFEHTGMPGISPFSPTTIALFITAFGGFGMIFSSAESTRPSFISIPLSLLCSLVVAAAVLWLFATVFHKTQSSSESHLGTMLGHTATVITPIPANGVGEIAYIQGGTRYTAPAREVDGAAVANGKTVKITRVSESQFYVTRC